MASLNTTVNFHALRYLFVDKIIDINIQILGGKCMYLNETSIYFLKVDHRGILPEMKQRNYELFLNKKWLLKTIQDK